MCRPATTDSGWSAEYHSAVPPPIEEPTAGALIEDLRTYAFDDLLSRYRTPALLLQGCQDTSVSWRDVADFATRCAGGPVDLHLFADGDHRLTDRKDRLWDLMMEFVRGRRLI
jgi:fermentation-respiration switch protein FrsA (DUF1100 family)